MSVFTIIANTPFWVWIVFVAVVLLGLGRTRDRTMTGSRLLILPAVILVLAGWNLVATGGTLASLTGLALGIIAGSSAGFALEARAGTTQVSRGVVHVKGDWISLVVVLAIFVNRYVSTVIGIVDPAVAAGAAYHFVTALVSGLFAFLTLTRTGLRLRIAYA